jgi:putative ABC transport system permease protein
MDKKGYDPPQFALRFFRWYCHPKLRHTIEGDLIELYHERLSSHGKKKANLNFILDIILLFRPSIVKPSDTHYPSNNYTMLKNYFTIGWRNLIRQKMYSLIKVGGFAIGIAACLLISLYIADELSYDKTQKDGDRTYRIIGTFRDNGRLYRDVWFPAPFAKVMKQDYPEVEMTGRFNGSSLFGAGGNEIRRSDDRENSHEEGFVYIDQELIDILQLPVVSGNARHLLDKPNTMVITRKKAEKYFRNEDPVGQTMIVNNDEQNPMTITGVLEDFPTNSHLDFDFLITMTGREFWKGEQDTWRASNYHTYMTVRPGTDIAALEKKATEGILKNYVLPSMIEANIANAEELIKNGNLEFQLVRDIHMASDISDGLSHGDMRFVWLFGAIAGFILLIASINFINLSTAKSANRAKEVGLRKAVGSQRSSIIKQFLTESILYSLLSFLAGIGLAYLLLPFFNVLAAKSLVFPWTIWWLLPATVIAILAIGILAGLYPSFYLSSFRPSQVLKGSISRGAKHSGARSALVVFQFTTSIVLIIATIIIFQQMDFILTRKTGFDKEQVLIIEGTQTLKRRAFTFKDELLQVPGVENVSISDYIPVRGGKRNGNGFWNEGKQKEDREVNTQTWTVDTDYIKTLGMKVVEGRDFSAQVASDSDAMIINQAMVRALGLKDPVGKKIYNYKNWNIIGVVEDFNFESMKENVTPLAMHLGLSSTMVCVKLDTENMTETLAAINTKWKSFAPNQSFRFSFLDQTYARMYADVQRTGSIFTTFSALAIIVACLGLFALSAFMVEQRGKEISIRLVLGASLNSVFQLLTWSFVRLVLISFIIAVPLAWFMMQRWLEDYVFRISIGWEVFILAGALAVATAVITISYQSIRAALVNPVDQLKAE